MSTGGVPADRRALWDRVRLEGHRLMEWIPDLAHDWQEGDAEVIERAEDLRSILWADEESVDKESARWERLREAVAPLHDAVKRLKPHYDMADVHIRRHTEQIWRLEWAIGFPFAMEELAQMFRDIDPSQQR